MSVPETRRFLIAALVVVLALFLGGCSDTTTYVQKDGLCYSRQIQRVFGVRVSTYQDGVKWKDCTRDS